MYKNFNPPVAQKFGLDVDEHSTPSGGGVGGGVGGGDGGGDGGGGGGLSANGNDSATKNYYVMISHIDENWWNVVEYNMLDNGTITLEKKSPHYICEFRSFNITGRQTVKIRAKMSPPLTVS